MKKFITHVNPNDTDRSLCGVYGLSGSAYQHAVNNDYFKGRKWCKKCKRIHNAQQENKKIK